jgi:hypothetical protein
LIVVFVVFLLSLMLSPIAFGSFPAMKTSFTRGVKQRETREIVFRAAVKVVSRFHCCFEH